MVAPVAAGSAAAVAAVSPAFLVVFVWDSAVVVASVFWRPASLDC
jgi:hypothetical protein